MEERELISTKVVETIGEYTIVKTKETTTYINGKAYGSTCVWYDVCLDNGDGDIVASYDNIKAVRKWAKEN